MKILNVQQIRALDQHTIENEPIVSINLMERAAQAFVKWFLKQFPNRKKTIVIYCGNGNNGGDGMAIARMLKHENYPVKVFWYAISSNSTEDFKTNMKWLQKLHTVEIELIKESDEFQEVEAGGILIDALFGSGLNRPLSAYLEALITYLNKQNALRVSVDIPSGLYADKTTDGISFLADYTFSFEMPKLAFVMPENQNRVGVWAYDSIGLDKNFIQNTASPFFYVDRAMVKPFLKQREKYDHKGTYGHAMLAVGSYGKVGAATLSAKACLRTGAGLVTVHAPKCAYEILQISFPEAMMQMDEEAHFISDIPNLSKYKSIGIGCGIDTQPLTLKALEKLIDEATIPLVVDADALNLIASKIELLEKLPPNSILTPHPKEFERLFGESENHFARNDLQRTKAREFGIYIILKGANTCTSTPEGNCYFNSTGNPGMGTAGSGDVLTGILTGLLAQGYSSFEACLLGVYLHGLAGDLAAEVLQEEALIAGDIIEYLGKAYEVLKQ